MDFDPVTGKLWDTELGPEYGDEINLVKHRFNIGWTLVEGMAYLQPEFDSNKLVDFNGKGNYSAPEFVWNSTVGPTAIKFFNSEKYGKEYQNDMFVADTQGKINILT